MTPSYRNCPSSPSRPVPRAPISRSLRPYALRAPMVVPLPVASMGSPPSSAIAGRAWSTRRSCRCSKSHPMPTTTPRTSSPTGVHNGISNHGVYVNDGDLISGQGQHGHGSIGRCSTQSLRNGGKWSGAQSPSLSNTSGRFGGSDDGSSALAAAHQQAALAGLGMGVGGFNLGLTSPALAGMPNGLSMAQLAQLNGMNGMNPFGVNMNMLGMANLNAMGITPEAQLLAAQIAAVGGGFGQPGLGLGGFGGLQGGMNPNGPRSNSGRSGGRSPGAGSGPGGGKSSGVANGGVKKDEEDFDPVILSDVPCWQRTLRLHKYTPNFEGMSWKEMVTM